MVSPGIMHDYYLILLRKVQSNLLNVPEKNSTGTDDIPFRRQSVLFPSCFHTIIVRNVVSICAQHMQGVLLLMTAAAGLTTEDAAAFKPGTTPVSFGGSAFLITYNSGKQ